jgi:hypothetical protein
MAGLKAARALLTEQHFGSQVAFVSLLQRDASPMGAGALQKLFV